MSAPGMREVEEMLGQLQLAEKSAISIEKVEEDYVLDIAVQNGNHSDKLLAATSSSHSIRLYKHADLANIRSIKGHDNTITGIKFGSEDPNILFSSSTDKSIRCWDVRTDTKKPVQVFEGYDETNNIFTSFDVNSNDCVLAAGTEADGNHEVHIIFWDRRGCSLLGSYSQSHCDDITQVRFHPSDADRLLTGSTDGLVCSFDISETSEDDALQYSLNPDSAVLRAGWCGEDLNTIYCVTHVDTFHMWDSQEGDAVQEILDIKDRPETRGKIDYLVDCLTSKNKCHLLAGTHSGEVHIIDVSGDEISVSASLTGGHSSTVRCHHWDSRTNTLVTGGEDSFLCLWSTVNKPVTDQKKVKLKMKKTVTKKQKPY